MKDTRKTQELAEQRRQLAMQYNQPNPNMGQSPMVQQAPQQQQPEEQPLDPKQYYQQLSEYATQRVAENLGEDFDEYNPVHQAALADEVATIKARMYERNVAQQNLKAVYNKYAQDPNMPEIDRYAMQRLQQLPYAQATQIQQALRTYDAPTIDAYMAAVRDDYYRNRGFIPMGEIQRPVQVPTPQQRPKPPYVESTGVAKNQPQGKPKLDYSKIGKLTLEDQAKIAARYGLG